MKRKIVYYVMVILSITILGTLHSCKIDHCATIVCQHGGSCDNGLCDCPDGYSGVFCEKLLTCNYVQWTGTGTCSDVGYYPVSNTSCCPSGSPYYFGSGCYSSCSAANNAANGATVYRYNDGTSAEYNCVSGTCVSASGAGQYSTLAACQSACGSSGGGYSCSSGNCIYVSSNAQYSTLAACESACGSGGGGYSCSGGDCIYVSSNAQYSTLAACESNCSTPVKGKFMAWTSVSEYGLPNGSNVMDMSIMGQTGYISAGHYTYAPSCNSTYCFTGELYPGTYTISGVIYGITDLYGNTPPTYHVSHTVTIYANQCSTVHFQ